MSQDLPNPIQPAPGERVSAGTPATAVESAVEAAAPVAPGPVKAGRGISNRALNLLLGGALVLAVAGIAFAAGRMTAPAQTLGGTFPGGGSFNGQGGTVQIGPGANNGQGGPRGVFGAGAGPSIEGTVESITDTTLTIKTADGQTIQIALDGDTSYHRQSDASASDVVTGSKVLVRLDFGRIDGNGPSATAGTDGGKGMTADDVTVIP